MASKEEVEEVLKDFKSLINQGKWTFVKRKINLQGLADLGLTVPQAKAEILSFRHYDRGPESDRDREGDFIWEREG